MVKIVQKEDKVLRKTCKEVLLKDIRTPKIKKIIRDMTRALDSQDDGVAIAAPQIGVPLRIFVVSKKIFPEDEKDKKIDLVYINPKIKKLSKKTHELEEGCLSVRWLYGDVKRATNATVEAYNQKGEKFTRGAGGLLAHIFQHEVDHLNGVLFTDKAKNLKEIEPEKLSRSDLKD